MHVELDEKVAQKVKELANSLGIAPDDAVSKIVEWYLEDCEKEN